MCRILGVTVLYMSVSGLDCLKEGGDLGRNDACKPLEGQLGQSSKLQGGGRPREGRGGRLRAPRGRELCGREGGKGGGKYEGRRAGGEREGTLWERRFDLKPLALKFTARMLYNY